MLTITLPLQRRMKTPQVLQLTMKLMSQLGKREINFAGVAA
jgi:hypothetical protein